VTIGYPDQIDSEASLAALALNVAGTSIGADFVMSRATAGAGGPGASKYRRALDQRGAHPGHRRSETDDRYPGGQVVPTSSRPLSDGTLV